MNYQESQPDSVFADLYKEMLVEKENLQREGRTWLAVSWLTTLKDIISTTAPRLTRHQKDELLKTDLSASRRLKIQSIEPYSAEEEKVLAAINILLVMIDNEVALSKKYPAVLLDLLDVVLSFLKKHL